MRHTILRIAILSIAVGALAFATFSIWIQHHLGDGMMQDDSDGVCSNAVEAARLALDNAQAISYIGDRDFSLQISRGDGGWAVLILPLPASFDDYMVTSVSDNRDVTVY